MPIDKRENRLIFSLMTYKKTTDYLNLNRILDGSSLVTSITRLEEKLRTWDAEISQRVLERNVEGENHHEEMSTIRREHAHFVNEQTRALRVAAHQEDESKVRMDQLVRAKAEAGVKIKAS